MGIFGLLFIVLPLIIIFIIIGVGINLLKGISRFFKFGRPDNGQSGSWNHRQQAQSHQHHSTNSTSRSKKIIGENEGEYVDFEEVE